MSLTSKVVIERNVRHDQRALMLERPRIARRVSIYVPTPQSSSVPRPPRSAPNTPKSIKAMLKLSKTKPFTLVGLKRSKAVISHPSTTTESVSTATATPQPSTSGLDEVAAERTTDASTSQPSELQTSTSESNQVATSETSTPAIDEDDEFYEDTLDLGPNQLSYETDSEDERQIL